MSDVFHAHFSVEQIQSVFKVMNDNPQHQFQVLTKRPERTARLASKLIFTPNIWIGASIENMVVAHRADALRQIPAAVRFISSRAVAWSSRSSQSRKAFTGLSRGGEREVSIASANPTGHAVSETRADATELAFFWKQWGGRTPKSGGRQLDGEEWNEYPVELSLVGRT